MFYNHDYVRFADSGPNSAFPGGCRHRKLFAGRETAEPRPVGGDIRNPEARSAVRHSAVRPRRLSARADGGGACAAAAGAPDRRGHKCFSRYRSKPSERIGSRVDDRARFHVPDARDRRRAARFHREIPDRSAAYLCAAAELVIDGPCMIGLLPLIFSDGALLKPFPMLTIDLIPVVAPDHPLAAL